MKFLAAAKDRGSQKKLYYLADKGKRTRVRYFYVYVFSGNISAIKQHDLAALGSRRGNIGVSLAFAVAKNAKCFSDICAVYLTGYFRLKLKKLRAGKDS